MTKAWDLLLPCELAILMFVLTTKKHDNLCVNK